MGGRERQREGHRKRGRKGERGPGERDRETRGCTDKLKEESYRRREGG